MMPSDHIAVAAVTSFVLIKRKVNPMTCVVIALGSHGLLDAIPHAEPALLGRVGSYMHWWNPEFWWVIVDHLIAGIIAWYTLTMHIETLWDRRFPLICFFAWAPDMIEPIHNWFDTDILRVVASIHELSHIPWRWLLDVAPNKIAPFHTWIIAFTTYVAFWILPSKFLARYEAKTRTVNVQAVISS